MLRSLVTGCMAMVVTGVFPGFQAQAQNTSVPEILSSAIPPPVVPAGPWTRPDIPVATCETPPRIDGILDDSCWKSATHALGFYRMTGAAPIPEQTEAWFCADRSRMYFAFHCLDSQPELIVANETRRNNSFYKDDFVAVDIDSQGTGRGLSSFVVTARGTQYDELEGGTASNISWAGDWKAAVKRVPDGWTAEMSIPFALLRYPRGTTSFGIGLFRQMARETSLQTWPYAPDYGARAQEEPKYLGRFAGIAPPYLAPRPVFLPYILATAGEESSVRQGIDIKYPLTTTMPGVANILPDFRTVKQDMENVGFSYTEKFYQDRRPFFAEGNQFLGDTGIFYSRRVPYVDAGLKLVGKAGNTTLGLLAIGTRRDGGQGNLVLNYLREIGTASAVFVNAAADSREGQSPNQVALVGARYGWYSGRLRNLVQLVSTGSWVGGDTRGRHNLLRFYRDSKRGRPNIRFDLVEMGADFTNRLGFVPERDYRGIFSNSVTHNEYDKGPVERYVAVVEVVNYNHATGGFYRRSLGAGSHIGFRNGLGIEIDALVGQHETGHKSGARFNDRIGTLGFYWNEKDLYRQGVVQMDFGRQAGQPYRFLVLSQGFPVGGNITFDAAFAHRKLGGDTLTQSVVSGAYRLNDETAVGGRLVRQEGNTNVYLSFGRSVRSGSDLFLLLGDPNSPRTRGSVTLKMVRPF